jgi:hypothetical protein
MSSPEKEYINWAPKRRIPLPSEAEDERILVRIRDFERIQKHVGEELPSRHDNIPAAYFALFGAALATGIAVPPLMTARGLPTWIIPTFIVSASAFLVLGLTLVLIARVILKDQRRAVSEIVLEMEDIKKDCLGKRNDQ